MRKVALGRSIRLLGVLLVLTSSGAAASSGKPAATSASGAETSPAAPSDIRLRVPINAGWRFKRQASPGAAVEAEFMGAEKPGFDDSTWSAVHLPHTWDATPENPFTFPGHFRGLGWYRRAFDVPNEWRGKRVHVEFKGVFQVADVWVNGHHAGHHAGGYTGFTLDVTDFIRWGEKNLLAVRVNDVLDPFIAPAVEANVADYGGIYRSVGLVVTSLIHFPSNPLRISVERGTNGAVTVEAATRVENPDTAVRARRLETRIVDADGQTVATEENNLQAKPKNVMEITGPGMTVPHPSFWSPDSPYLYTLVSTLYDGGRAVDRVVTPFGVRFMGYDPSTGFTLNGKPIVLRGVDRRQDYGFLGDAVPEAVAVRDVEIMKAMGVNFLRTAHYPQDPAFLDACDRLGILVWEEIPNIKVRIYPPAPDNTEPVYSERFPRPLMDNLKQQLREMIERDRNHPAIIIWGLGDDLSTYHYPEDFVELVDAAHALDPSRWTAARSPHVTDVIDATSEPNLVEEHAKHPERKYIWNEWGSVASQRGTEGRPYYLRLPADPLADVSFADSDAAQILEGYLMQWNALPWLGTAKWCMFDTGEPNSMRTRILWSRADEGVTFRWPFDDYLGVADMWRLPKEGYYFLQSQWSEKPMVHIVGRWTWPGQEGRPRTVRVYSNCDTVGLLLNGKSLGTRKPETNEEVWRNFKRVIDPFRSPGDFDQQMLAGAGLRHPPFEWSDVAYEPGDLVAVCGNNPAGVRDELQTASVPARIVLKAEKQHLAADDADVSFIEADVVDKNGVVVPDARPWISFAVRGPGRLLGGATEIDATSGVAAINVQSTGEPGEIQVTATAAGLAPGDARIDAK